MVDMYPEGKAVQRDPVQTTNRVLVEGAKNAAIYDFKSGKVYSINQEGKKILKKFKKGGKLSSSEQEFIEEIKNIGLENFVLNKPVPKKLRETLTSKLESLELEVTSECNLRCLHCYGNFGEPDRKELPLEKCYEILEDARELGSSFVQFSGGEPLLERGKIFQLIDFANSCGFKNIKVLTNGTLIDREIAEELAERDLYSVQVSLYSHRKKNYESITQVKGSFERAVKGLKLLKELGVKVEVATPLMKQNQEDLEGVKSFLRKMDIDPAKSHFIDPVKRSGRCDSQTIPGNQILEKRVRDKASFKTSRKSFLRFKYGNSCWQGVAKIASNGDVLPCSFTRNLVMGNVINNSLKEVINGKETKKYWFLTKDDITPCCDCEYRYCCFDCRALALEGSSKNVFIRGKYCLYDPYKGEWISKAEK